MESGGFDITKVFRQIQHPTVTFDGRVLGGFKDEVHPYMIQEVVCLAPKPDGNNLFVKSMAVPFTPFTPPYD